MSLTITTTSLASNKPPLPKPTPPATLFPTQKTLKDGRTIWISVPQPDRLTLIVPLLPEVFNPKAKGLSVTDFVQKTGDYLMSEPYNAHHADSQYWPEKGYRYVTLKMGVRGSFVRFEFLNNKNDGPRLRLEMNPRKLGPEGFKQLKMVLGAADAPFNLTKLVGAAKITRLDIAVDIVGVEVSEIVISHKDQGKRSYYVGSDGQLETIFVHRKLKLKEPKYDKSGDPKKLSHGSKPAGAVLVRAYDRVRERTTLLRPAPFGPAPVTRVEIEITRFKKWADFKLLGDMTDRFQNVRVGFHGSQVGPSGRAWQRYQMIRRTSDAKAAAAAIGLQSSAIGPYEEAYNAAQADLVAPDTTWAGWHEGVVITGLSFLLVD